MKTSFSSFAGAMLAAAGFFVAAQVWLPDEACHYVSGSGRAEAEEGEREAEGAGCRRMKHPESAFEIMAVNDSKYRRAGVMPTGTFRAAVEQKRALESQRSKVAGAAGTWQPYGKGNLRVGGDYDQIAARVDNFYYDSINQRLFAAVGTGGIWMSQPAGGDLTTLGDLWVSVGDALPSQVTGAVAWTPAGGPAGTGTLIAVGGEAVMGSSGYLGLGGFWSDDLGATWNQAIGIPDGALAFQAAVDHAHPEIIYAATSKGLFRSANAGRTYVNVRLPTHNEEIDCAGVESLGPCQFTNYVLDVVVQEPGGSTEVTCSAGGCPVLAAVGYRTGNDLAFQDGRPMAGDNGLYRSDTGAVGSFAKLDVSAAVSGPVGFTPQNRIGRIELGAAIGETQDHNLVYAIVQDAVLFNTGLPYIDAPIELPALPLPTDLVSSVFNGIYVSPDFGGSWIRMADYAEIVNNPATLTALTVQSALGYSPGVQAWYNAWIKPDPTRTDPGLGAPTRMTFGLEEVWQNAVPAPLNGVAQQGESDFQVIGAYNSLGPGVIVGGSTTHPDQHTGIYVPTGDGGVCLFAGGDGGVFRQCSDATGQMDNSGWTSANTGMYTLLPYGLAVSKNGTVWWGLQDNGSGSTDPRSRESTMWFGADGFFAAVDPDHPMIAYTESQNAGMVVTTDGGQSSTGITPSGMTGFMFDNYFTMDPSDAQHLIAGGTQIFETTLGPEVRPATWTQVFVLPNNATTDAVSKQTTLATHGPNSYVGFCGDCGVSGNDTGFKNGIATNVGGDKPPQKASPDGWHVATAAGLDNRYITSIWIDPKNPRTVYVTLAGYLSNLRPPGSYIDPNTNIGSGVVFKSTDAGESFQDISGNLPGVPANSVILSGNGAQLLVGTDVGAFISSDTNGSNWAPLGTGLPNVPVNMLRLRPGRESQVFAATFGRHLWVYDLQGSGGSQPEGSSRYSITGAMPASALLLLALGALIRRRRH